MQIIILNTLQLYFVSIGSTFEIMLQASTLQNMHEMLLDHLLNQ